MAIDLDPSTPDSVAGTSTTVGTSLTSTTQTAVQNLSNANCLATGRLEIRAHAGAVDSGVGFSRQATESPSSLLEYLGIIATNDFFVQIQGTNNVNVKKVSGKLYGYRAKASADI